MEDVNQIRLINKALNSEREKYLYELAKIHKKIEKKLLSINKIKMYQDEYSNDNNLKLTKSIPLLHNNLQSFSQKIADVITHEEEDLFHLKKSLSFYQEKIEKIDQKLKLFSNFEKEAIIKKIIKEEKLEQLLADDLATVKKSRGDYE